MDFSVIACIACASDRCNAIETLGRNHVHNKLIQGLDLAHSLDANVAHKKWISMFGARISRLSGKVLISNLHSVQTEVAVCIVGYCPTWCHDGSNRHYSIQSQHICGICGTRLWTQSELALSHVARAEWRCLRLQFTGSKCENPHSYSCPFSQRLNIFFKTYDFSGPKLDRIYQKKKKLKKMFI